MTYVQQLLLDFNSNIQKNSELIDYINQKNVFSTIGKDRNELVHTKMIAELLCGDFYHNGSESTMMHFFDVVIRRASMQNKELKDILSTAVLTRMMKISSIEDYRTEYTIKSYFSDIKRNKTSDSQCRLDLYIRLKLKSNLKNHTSDEVEIFIENKVDSLEHDNQTDTYFNECSNCQGEKRYQIFVYISPISTRELDQYADDLQKPNNNFIWINYQDLLEYVIEPLLDDNNLTNQQNVLLKEYVRCLELPALPDKPENEQDKDKIKVKAKEVKSLSIMATSSYEKELVGKFLQEEINRRVLDAVILTQGGLNSYTVNNTKWISLSKAVEIALHESLSRNGVTKVLDAFDGVFAKGGSPFLIYVPDLKNEDLEYVPKDLFAVNGHIFKTRFEAICESIRYLYKDRKLSYEELSATLNSVFAKKTLSVLSNEHIVGYDKIEGTEIYIRNNIGEGKFDEICGCLKNMQCDIALVSDEQYIQLVQFGNYRSMLHNICAAAHYQQLENTNYFYRIDIKNKLDVINDCLKNIDGFDIQENNRDESERDILKTFYNKHKSLFISVYKIMLESIKDDGIYKQRQKEYSKLLKVCDSNNKMK